MITADACYLALILTISPHSSRALKCFHGTGSNAVEVDVEVNMCVFYEINSCNNPQRYRDSMSVDDMYQVDNRCGVFENSTYTSIAACFCSTDSCNGDSIKDLIETSIQNERILPGVASWSFTSISESTRAIMTCFKQNMFPVDESVDLMAILIPVGIVVVILLCICLPIAYHFKEKRRKKRLAETWDQRVKEAGKEIEKEGDSSVFTGSAVPSGGKKK
uniref:Protein sleepless n=1 Tax=Haemonchus contortus TaxID=6289 RepID=A0A7I4YB82_HAECO